MAIHTAGAANGDDNPADSNPVASADAHGETPIDLPVDEYEGFEAESARIAALFADPVFRQREQERRTAHALTPIRRTNAGGSMGRALALGFANVFDPDRKKDDVVMMQERGDGDGDVPDTELNPDDPTATRVIYRRRDSAELS
jgi:hypothetical protein